MIGQIGEEYAKRMEENGSIQKIKRPLKIDWFMEIAEVVSKMSMDAQTKVGCVVTNKQNRILGTGYNSFPRGCDNDKLPNLRPDKYPWMTHAEDNAIRNCILKPLDVGGGIAYITSKACWPCTKLLWDSGIETIYEGPNKFHCYNEEHEELKKILTAHTTLKIISVSPN